jgi:hypothetical protein
MSYSSLNAKIYRRSQGTLLMANISNNKNLDANYGISVEVAAPIRRVCFFFEYRRVDTSVSGPKGFIRPIHCWVAIDSKAKHRGVVVAAVGKG